MINESVLEKKNTTTLFFLAIFLMVIFSLTGAGCAPAVPASQTTAETNATARESNPAAATAQVEVNIGAPSLTGEAKTETTVVVPTPVVSPVTAQPAITKPGASVPAPTPAAKPSATLYKDGTYSADGVYSSPAGAEDIGVTLTLKGDVVTDASVVPHATNMKSKFMQGMFIDGYKAQVIGKNISDLHLTKISGSSLTPAGFNDAVAKIEVQAKA